MKVLVDDEKLNVYRVPALGQGVYAHPLGGGGYHCQGPTFGVTAASKYELDLALGELIGWDVPHARLAKRSDYGYEHKPTGLVIERSTEEWPNGRGATVQWDSTIAHVRVRWSNLSSARGLLRILAGRQGGES